MDHGCCDGAEGVVVAKLDFLDAESVVLVDDGDDAHVEEFDEGVLSIEVLRAVGDVVACEQDLGDGLAHLREQVVPHAHQLALAHCRECLNLREMFWSSLHVELAQGHADGARGAEDDAVAIATEADCSLNDGRESA